jgi:hypothetical protein
LSQIASTAKAVNCTILFCFEQNETPEFHYIQTMKTLLFIALLAATSGSQPIATNDEYYVPDAVYEEFVPSWMPLYT